MMADNIIEIDCGESLTIAQVAGMYSRLLTSLAEEQAVSIDISRIERIDTAAVQMLYSFQRDARTQGVVIIWSDPSKVFCDTVDILGMNAFYIAA
ncbi:STAS domain-containing protein [Methylophaga sp. OBS4]|uniref:STAS domain-containing protein n=1 Tax=Methylophaga sp. OBS4 TaxID=2991935 RepID=UPI00225023F0|nr:STAS domain-containing protein [Methylophaga sp. OBS4]MCX4187386.1 STAS domain-containing protein [Methylophaga sp. OBS4]